MTDHDHDRDVARIIALVEGLQSGHIRCACGRHYAVGIAEELRLLMVAVKAEIAKRTGEPEAIGDGSRFALIEIDGKT